MKVLITGAAGQLGRELGRRAPAGVEIHARSRQELDLADAESVARTVGELSPDLILNAGAYTAVDRAEQERELAFAVNAEAVGRLAVAAAESGSRLIHVSTDFVFSGAGSRPYCVDDEPDPRSVYGRSKLDGESRALEPSGGDALVIRSSWLYSRFGRNFVKTMVRLMREQGSVSVVADQIGTPTWAWNLAGAIWRAAERPDLRGLLHVADAGVASWYDFAVAIYEEAVPLGLVLSGVVVRPVGSEEYPTAATRPRFSVLDCRAAWRALGLEPCHWRSALRSMLSELSDPSDAG